MKLVSELVSKAAKEAYGLGCSRHRVGKIMKLNTIATLAVAAALAVPASIANAATYVSYLEYKNTAPNTQVSVADRFGEVRLTQLTANSVGVVVHLYSPQKGFLNTGNGDNKAPFTFNLTDDYDVVTDNYLAGQQFEDGGYSVSGGHGTFQNNNFGLYTNKINCCGGVTGGAAFDPGDLRFVVTNNAVGGTLTFAGVGAQFDAGTGRLLSEGTGPRFLSTIAVNPARGPSQPGGFWFAADVITTSGATFDVAARDAFLVPNGVPEPGVWALMVLGFGGAGAMLRRRRQVAA